MPTLPKRTESEVTVTQIDPRGPLAQDLRRVFRAAGVNAQDVNIRNGWDRSRKMEAAAGGTYDPEWISTHKIAELGLIMTEASEAIEEVRDGHEMDETYYSFKPVPPSLAVEFSSGAEAREAWEKTQLPKPEGVPSELADILIRTFSIAEAYGIDLGEAFIEKLNYNATRGLRHGGKLL